MDAHEQSQVPGSVDRLPPFESPPDGEEATIAAVAEGRAAMWCERPGLDGSEIAEEHVEVKGWAAAGEGIDRVLVAIDGGPPLRAIHGLSRPDLRWCFGDAVAADCGFALRLDPADLPPGKHEVTVVAMTQTGRGVGMSGAVNRLAYSPPQPTADEGRGAPTGRALEPGERFVPRLHHGTSMEPEHYVRYDWAASLVADSEVLDAGCGTGWGTVRLARRAKLAVGVDLAPVAIAEAQRDYGRQAEFVEGDLLALPFDDDSFDVAVCFEAIEQISAPERALDELRRVLRPDGLLLASASNRGVYPPGNPFHLHEFTSAEFQAAVEKRFASVGVYRQQTYVSSLLGNDAELELDDPDARLSIQVRKLFGERPGNELHAVVAASDADLPPPPSELALGGRVDHSESARVIEMWQERAIRAEVHTAAIRNETFYQTEQQRKTIARAAARAEHHDAELAKLEALLVERDAELEEARGYLRGAENLLETARGDAEAVREELFARSAELEEARGYLRGAENLLETARLDAAIAKGALEGATSSVSWRVTKPLRAAKRLFTRRPNV